MRQLLPRPRDDLDLYEAYRPDDAAGPLLRVNMVTTLDGAVTDEHGRSRGLGSSGDLEVFRSLRAHADAILVGAGTVRTEGYGPHRVREDLAARRRADGRDAPAAIVVVTASLDLDLDGPLFSEAQTPTVVLTCTTAPDDLRAAAERAGRVVVAGDRQVDLASGLEALRAELGHRHVLCEGGPHLIGLLLEAGLVDELCVTVAPALAWTGGPRMAGHLAARVDLDLVAAIEHDGELYLRYRVQHPGA